MLLLQWIAATALLPIVFVIGAARDHPLDVLILSIAATAQAAILLAACLGDRASYESVVDATHWLFGITVALACVLGSHDATLAYVVAIVALTMLARCARQSRGEIPCPFDAAAPTSIPDIGKHSYDAYYMAVMVVAAARLSARRARRPPTSHRR